MKSRNSLQLLAMAFFSVALLSASPSWAGDDVRSKIEAANKLFEAAVSRGDGRGVAALYTNDAQLLPSQSDFITGKDPIAQFWQAAIDSGMTGVRGAEGKVLDHGKYVVIWKMEGSWKLHRDIWNSSVAPPEN
jgi:ketosteroid isomerase-like protein